MFENIKDGDLITLKLASGEEVVCTLESHGIDIVSIKNGLVLMQGPQGLAFGTFFVEPYVRLVDIEVEKEK